MTSPDSRAETLREYGRVLRRWKWFVIAPTLVVPLAAVIVSLTQSPLYRGTTPVLLTRQNVPPTGDQVLFPDRFVQGQANFARTPAIASTAARAAGTGESAQQLLDNSEVVPSRSADILLFAVTDRYRNVARRLSRTYAVHYTLHRRAFDRAQLAAALEETEAQIRRLRSERATGTPIYSNLLEQRRVLTAGLATRMSDAFVIDDVQDEKVRPLPARNGALGLVLGLGLGVALALLCQAFDRRVRSSSEVSSALGLPVLGRIPAGRARRARVEWATTLEEPPAADADALRLLRANVDAAVRRRGISSVLVMSATAGREKSALAAYLARGFASTGRRVLLVDLDLAEGGLGALAGDTPRPGVTDVLADRAKLADVIVEARWGAARERSLDAPVQVLPRGTTAVAAAGDLYASPRMAALLESLRDSADLVLVDGPAAERAADVMVLAPNVESVLVVASLDDLKRPHLQELRRLLEAIPAAPLGLVITAAEQDEAPAPVEYEATPARTPDPTAV